MGSVLNGGREDGEAVRGIPCVVGVEWKGIADAREASRFALRSCEGMARAAKPPELPRAQLLWGGVVNGL